MYRDQPATWKTSTKVNNPWFFFSRVIVAIAIIRDCRRRSRQSDPVRK